MITEASDDGAFAHVVSLGVPFPLCMPQRKAYVSISGVSEHLSESALWIDGDPWT